MGRNSRWWRRVLLLVVLGLVATACRDTGGGQAAGGGTEGEGEIAFDTGVTDEPCPDAVNQDNGCIYLGTISDLTEGPFAALAVPITESQKAFWRKVNEDGGIGGFDVNVTEFVRDNKYNPQVHNQVFQEIRGDVLGLAQTLGSPTTAAIIDQLESEKIVSAPASWTSLWLFEDVIVESGNNYCIESMNSVDYAVDEFGTESVMAVHYDGDYGDDAAAGAQIAAEANELDFVDVETTPGQENQAEAVGRIVRENPDLVIVTTGPTDLAVIAGQAAAKGFKGKFIGTSPTWNPALLESPAAEALKAQYLQSSPWGSFNSDTPGHEAMRQAVDAEEGNDGYTSGWAWSYPLKAALEQAAENGDLTRAGVFEAVTQLETVDYQGMLPEGAGNFAGEPNEAAVRETLIQKPDESVDSGVSIVEDFFVGPTAEDYDFTQPCYQG